MVAIIDYGMGNIHSVEKALKSFGAETLVTNNPQDIRTCEKVVLPGVGAFDDAMRELDRQDIISALKEHLKRKKIFLGICLGMQLLFEDSQEAKATLGTSILKGSVKRFEGKNDLKVPHIGWNELRLASGNCPLLKNIPDNSYVYFCHSYYAEPKNKDIIAAKTGYGIDFTSVVWQDNIYGTQFHPEKSQTVGLKILENFVNL